MLEILIAALMLAVATPAAPNERPNVIVIFADDLGYGDLGCYGHPKFKTPRLDRMAGEGARFTDFYSCCPYCAPSRAGLLTGRYQLRNGVTRNPTPDAGINDVGLPDREITIAEALRPAGYRTCCIGKWHLGHKPEFYPRRQGFDEYYGILYSNDMRPVELIENETRIEYPVVQATLTRRYTDRAVSFILRNRARPFFLYLPHAMPHKPLAASEAFYKKSGSGLYGDVIAELDATVGRILDTLAEAGLDRRTVVFFTSDNGPWFGGSAGGLRGMKGMTWEGGTRVPMIARWPEQIPAGSVVKSPSMTLDLFPTILKLAGVEAPKDRVIDGHDLWPLLAGQSTTSPHDAIFGIRGEALCTVRSGDWKLHVQPPGARFAANLGPGERWIDPRGPDGVTILAPYEQHQPSDFPGLESGDVFERVGLFNLVEDPSEQHNLANRHPEIVARLQLRIAEFKETLAE